MDTGLKGKVVVITGAAKGIGKATALAFAKEGANLALIDLDKGELDGVKTEAEGLGVKVGISTADQTTNQGVRDGIAEATKPFGGTLDVLFNNVGAGAVRTFEQLTDDDWNATMNLNFMAYVRAMRIALPELRRKRGNIVNNASDLARQPEPVPVDYSVSKAAVLSLTKALARAEGPNGVRINAIAPGPVWTPFWTKPGGFAETMGQYHKKPPQEAVEYEMSLRQLPLGRLGKPEEVANVVVFLASDLATFITSSVYGVDGGSIRNII
jgi:NAD(P)-dependent dehydrogenase (short-subunit alcohol dehydrogenase family)